jgi:hypothetical protein
MTTAIETENYYYLSALGTAATMIGSISVSPNLPPKRLTQEQYEAEETRIKFYESHGVISVARPGTREAVMKADEIRNEEERLAEIYAGESNPDDEPDPVLLGRGFAVSEKYADSRLGQRSRRQASMSTFSAPGEVATDSEAGLKCVAATSRGTRCKHDAQPDMLVCGTHLRVLKKGQVLRDDKGRRISKTGKMLIPE